MSKFISLYAYIYVYIWHVCVCIAYVYMAYLCVYIQIYVIQKQLNTCYIQVPIDICQFISYAVRLLPCYLSW